MKIPDHVPWLPTGRTLGSGGQGQVQLVTRRNEPGGHQFALKELRNAASSQARKRFQREIQAVKGLNHSSIVEIIDHSKADDDFHYYVMEYHEGARDLEKVLFSGANPYEGNVEASLCLFEQIISAIRACENSNPRIVHRDISPRNLLMLPNGAVRLIDFGICQLQDNSLITLTDENVGTRNYTSPECEFGEDTEVGVHSDIYSAAKVLWSAITSRRAFAREEPVFGNQSMESIFPTKPDSWHLMLIFEKTIRRQPSDRWQSTREVLEEIAEVKYIIRRGFPPLKEVGKRCPNCGAKNIAPLSHPEVLVTNHNPAVVSPMICNTCGLMFVRNKFIWNNNLERTQGLN